MSDLAATPIIVPREGPLRAESRQPADIAVTGITRLHLTALVEEALAAADAAGELEAAIHLDAARIALAYPGASERERYCRQGLKQLRQLLADEPNGDDQA